MMILVGHKHSHILENVRMFFHKMQAAFAVIIYLF